MKIEIYLDSLFFLNLMINVWILQLIKNKIGLDISGKRIWFSAALGAVCYILTFFVPGSSLVIQPAFTLLSLMLMSKIILPRRKKRYFPQALFLALFYGFVLSGILRTVFAKWNVFLGKPHTMTAVLAGVYLCVQIGIVVMKKWRNRAERVICDVTIYSAGQKMTVKALVDTGNSLTEPLSKKPVCIMEEAYLAKITLENPLFFRAIPYRSVGCEQGILYGVEIPKIQFVYDHTLYTAEHVVCAAAPGKVSTKDTYRMILHPALLQGPMEKKRI